MADKSRIFAFYSNNYNPKVMDCAENNKAYYTPNAQAIQNKVEDAYKNNNKTCIEAVYQKQNGIFAPWKSEVCSLFGKNKGCYTECKFNQTLIDIIEKGCKNGDECF